MSLHSLLIIFYHWIIFFFFFFRRTGCNWKNEKGGRKGLHETRGEAFCEAHHYFNPLYTSGLFHSYMLDESVCHFRCVGSILSFLFYFLMENPVSKQCTVDPDQMWHLIWVCTVCLLFLYRFQIIMWMTCIDWSMELKTNTEDPRYNDSVRYQRFCCKIEFAVIKKLDMDLSKAWIMDIFVQLFYKSYVLYIC